MKQLYPGTTLEATDNRTQRVRIAATTIVSKMRTTHMTREEASDTFALAQELTGKVLDSETEFDNA